MISIKIGGAAGQGVFVLGRSLGRLFLKEGFYVFGYPEYPSLIRGGHNAYQIILSSNKIYSPLDRNDIILALNKQAIKFHKPHLSEKGFIITDESIEIEGENIIKSPLTKIISEVGGNARMLNIALMGEMAALMNLNLNNINEIIESEFSKKGEKIVEINQLVAKNAYDYIKEHYPNTKIVLPEKPEKRKRYYIGGNESLGLGFIKGGLKFYSAYPMTPASSLLHFLVKKAEKHKINVIQSEDEIAAANMAVGAAFSGLRAATGTSGGGFALMTETVGMAALAETPIVFFIAQRTGPSTGMPTWTEQADLFQALGASQGEFLRIILAPQNAEDMIYIGSSALNLAEKYQLPVIILSDKFLSESHYTVEDITTEPIERGKIADNLPNLNVGERFKRYLLTDDGISPRTFPGMANGEHVATSYEHEEDSYSTENFEMRAKQVNKRLKKLRLIEKEAYKPEIIGEGDVDIITWGSHFGIAHLTQKMLKEEGINVRVVNFRWIYPLFKHMVDGLNEKRIIVENNRTGLFEKLLRMELNFNVTASIRKFNGRPMFPIQLKEKIKEVLNDEFKQKIYLIEKEEFEPYEYYSPWRYE